MAAPIDSDWDELARDLARRVDVAAPGWTDTRDSDPGITIAELIAFLGESLLGQPDRSERARTRLSDIITALGAKLQDPPCKDVVPPTRVRYFHGQFLSADDFQQEQDYVRAKQRLHNLHMHGWGIVNGLGVTVAGGSTADETKVEVSPGLAIGPDGEELLVCERTTSPLKSDRTTCFVTLRQVDRLLATVPTSTGEEASRVQETVDVGVFDDVPASHLTLARLERVGDSWRVDPTFRARRSRTQAAGE